MLKMRLQRIGRRNRPAYRVLVVDSRQGPKSGKYVDLVGSYDPLAGSIQIDGEKAKGWVEKGVQLSPTVHNMLIDQKVIEGKKVNALPKKRPVIKESAEADAPAENAEEATPATEDSPKEAPSDTATEATEDAVEKEDVPASTSAESTSEEEPEKEDSTSEPDVPKEESAEEPSKA